MEQIQNPFELDTPEVYQVEVSTACNLHCTMCPRTLAWYGKRQRPVMFMPVETAALIGKRDLGSSYYVELQMAGEPLLHPDFEAIVEALAEAGVMLGLSTNGHFIKDHLHALNYMEAITVSVDSMFTAEYADLRVGGTLSNLEENIHALLSCTAHPLVDLQVLELPGVAWLETMEMLNGIWGTNPRVLVRSAKDCYEYVFKGPGTPSIATELCSNPWISVSIHSNGDVVPCCFAWGDHVIYGNVNTASLSEIWERSAELRWLRARHRASNFPMPCQYCLRPSPWKLHWNLMSSYAERRRRYGIGCANPHGGIRIGKNPRHHADFSNRLGEKGAKP